MITLTGKPAHVLFIFQNSIHLIFQILQQYIQLSVPHTLTTSMLSKWWPSYLQKQSLRNKMQKKMRRIIFCYLWGECTSDYPQIPWSQWTVQENAGFDFHSPCGEGQGHCLHEKQEGKTMGKMFSRCALCQCFCHTRCTAGMQPSLHTTISCS